MSTLLCKDLGVMHYLAAIEFQEKLVEPCDLGEQVLEPPIVLGRREELVGIERLGADERRGIGAQEFHVVVPEPRLYFGDRVAMLFGVLVLIAEPSNMSLRFFGAIAEDRVEGNDTVSGEFGRGPAKLVGDARVEVVQAEHDDTARRHPSHAALGQIKFEMPNRFDVYLHDTPMKALFSQDNRRRSHGCVRVQNPRELASLLLQEPGDAINRGVAVGYTHRKSLPSTVAVFFVYQTAFADAVLQPIAPDMADGGERVSGFLVFLGVVLRECGARRDRHADIRVAPKREVGKAWIWSRLAIGRWLGRRLARNAHARQLSRADRAQVQEKRGFPPLVTATHQ